MPTPQTTAAAPRAKLGPPPRRSAGRPPKVADPFRWQLYVNNTRRAAARERAGGDEQLADVMRSFLDNYAAGTIDAPEPVR